MHKLILIMIVAIGSITSVNAAMLTYTIMSTSGQFVYNFTLSNTAVADGTLFDLFLSLATDITNIDTATIGAPVGWGDPTGGLLFFGPDVAPSTSFVEWAADFSGIYDLGFGNSLGGFSFLSSQRINEPLAFALNGTTDFATAHEVSSVPEPATFVLVLLVLVTVAPFRIRSRSAQGP
jgi:hypothetical protein